MYLFAYCILHCTGEIQTFLTGNGENYRQLNDQTWPIELWLLTDITNHFKDFNLCLQGNEVIILKM